MTYLVALPVLPLVVILRAGGDALRARRLVSWLTTLPVQLAGHFAWCLGEAKVHRATAFGAG